MRKCKISNSFSKYNFIIIIRDTNRIENADSETGLRRKDSIRIALIGSGANDQNQSNIVSPSSECLGSLIHIIISILSTTYFDYPFLNCFIIIY